MKHGRPWTVRDDARLIVSYPTLPTAYIAFRMGRTPHAIVSRAKKFHVQKSGYHVWTPAEDRRLRAMYLTARMDEIKAEFKCSAGRIYNRARSLGIRRSPEWFERPLSGRMRPGSSLGKGHRYRKGNVPANKGLKRPGWAPGRMADTQFKRGNRPQTWERVGTERVTYDGYRRLKVRDDLRPGRLNWEYVHVRTWVAAHGPIPLHHAIVFRDGDRMHCALQNLELVSRVELMRRNSVHRLPPALQGAIQLRGALVHRINNRSKRNEKQD